MTPAIKQEIEAIHARLNSLWDIEPELMNELIGDDILKKFEDVAQLEVYYGRQETVVVYLGNTYTIVHYGRTIKEVREHSGSIILQVDHCGIDFLNHAIECVEVALLRDSLRETLACFKSCINYTGPDRIEHLNGALEGDLDVILRAENLLKP